MRTKEKKEKKVKITIKNLMFFFVFVVFLFYAIVFYNLYFSKTVYATEDVASKDTDKTKISHAKKINLEDIIIQNTNDGQREEYEVKEEVLEYITKYRTNTSIPKGIVQVVQEGRQGMQEITIKKTYKDEEVIREEQETQIQQVTEESHKSTGELKNTLSFNMGLNKPSGLSIEQFKKVLTDSKDKNHIFAEHAEYFYYIEKQYHINGIFVASVAIHESAWETSKIALEKKNLFGYGAYDTSPYNSAYQFSEYSECIDLLARVFVKYYLNPKGTNIYGGEVAIGSYYHGATLTGVNIKYATDKNWANRVYQHMQYLYNKL